MFPPPDPDSDDGRHAAEAARALLPLLEEMRPHVVVSDILTLAPTLAAELAGIPLATLIPHIYPVVEPGLPFFAIGLKAPRTPVGRAGLAGWAAGAEDRPGARPPRPQRAARAPRPAADRPLPRRHQPRPCPGRHLPPARVPKAVAGGGRGHRPDDLRAPAPRDRAAARGRAARPRRPQHGARFRQPPGARRSGGAGRASRCGWSRRPTASSPSSRSPSPRTPSSSTGSATPS